MSLALALPMRSSRDAFATTGWRHLGPIYLATAVFVVGVVLAHRGLQAT